MKIRDFQSQVCVCAASANLICAGKLRRNGVKNGILCLCGRNVRMQLWRCAVGADGDAGEPGERRCFADGNDYGLCAGQKYPSVRHVLLSGKSAGGRGHGGSARGSDADAVYSRRSRAVGARRADAADRRKTGAESEQQGNVYVGRRDSDHKSGKHQFDDTVEEHR